MEIDKKKEAASTWFKLLRDQFCEVFEKHISIEYNTK